MQLLQVTHDQLSGTGEIAWQASADPLLRRCPRRLPLTDPLGLEDRDHLRWYLEEYLQFPYGAERSRAEQVERRMAEWGEALFAQLFPKLTDVETDPRSLYQAAVTGGLEQCQ